MVSLFENGTLPLVPDVVVVDPDFQRFSPLVAAARAGRLNLHLRASGGEAIKLARRLSVDAWLVSPKLDDMAGDDFVALVKALPHGATHAIAMIAPTDSTKTADAGASLRHPISLDAVEALLRSPATSAAVDLAIRGRSRARALLSLPVGVGAAMLAIAALMLV